MVFYQMVQRFSLFLVFPFVSFFWTNVFVHFFLIIDIYASLQMLLDFLSQLFHLQFYFLKGPSYFSCFIPCYFWNSFDSFLSLCKKIWTSIFCLLCCSIYCFFFFIFFSILSLSDSRSYSFTYTHSLFSVEYLLFCIYYLWCIAF